MSELINNSEHRKEELKRIILKLHDGEEFDVVKEEFDEKFGSVSAMEIADMERSLVKEGMPIENIQLLCDVHAAVLGTSVEEIHAENYLDRGFEEEELDDEGYPLNHPVSIFKRENRYVEDLVEEELLPALEVYVVGDKAESDKKKLVHALKKLSFIDKHYARKEYLIFPVMENNGITAPPQVMWGVDDEIRGKLKNALALLEAEQVDEMEVDELVKNVSDQIIDMIFKEEAILLPMIADFFTDEEWEKAAQSADDFGYMIRPPKTAWKAPVTATTTVSVSGDASSSKDSLAAAKDEDNVDKKIENNENQGEDYMEGHEKFVNGRVLFDAGSLSPDEVNAILNTVPFDMTFVGADDKVKYFTQGKERIFERPKTVIGREVKNCHPPKSVHVVEEIVESFRSGEKDEESFWIQKGDMFVLIAYYAVRNREGEFLGTLEVSQDIKPLRDLEGERRLMSE